MALGYAGCAAYQEGVDTSYGYIPSEAASIVFVVLFALSMLAHLAQSIWSRQWWTIVFFVGALTEVLGWAGRVWSSQCVYNANAYLLQLITLIIAPTFFTAGFYVILGNFIKLKGRDTSPLSHKAYLWIFCSCDILSLVIQAIGGGMAATAIEATPPEDTAPGTHIMVAGIVFQLASVTAFVALFAIFFMRILGRKIGRNDKIMIAGTTLAIIVFYIRSVYRTIELSQGWTGYLITHERYFIVLDGVMMILCVGVFNFVHPGLFLRMSANGSSVDREELEIVSDWDKANKESVGETHPA